MLITTVLTNILATEIRNAIYAIICGRLQISDQSLLSPSRYYTRHLFMRNYTSERPLAIVSVSQQVRHEFLSLWLNLDTLATNTECVGITELPRRLNLNFDASQLFLYTYATCGDKLAALCATFRTPNSDNPGHGALFNFIFDSERLFELTDPSKNKVESTLGSLFRTNDDITFGNFLQAVDRVFSIGLDAEPRGNERCPDAHYSNTCFKILIGSEGTRPKIVTSSSTL